MKPAGEATGDLFGVAGAPGGSPPLPPDTMRVSTLANRIQAALRQTFPRRVWVVGEAAELERGTHRKHWFFRLCENNPGDGKKYALGAVLWASEVRRLFGRGGTLDGVIEPRDGIEIRVLCDIDFYPPNGDLRLIVRDIDAAYTLGKIALERQQLIERLSKEGVFDPQKRLGLPVVPLHIGLITSENSAAYNDFVKELLAPELAFRVRFFDARMQGEDTVPTVISGLRTLSRLEVDAIALVRGGGSSVDLAWFDREEIVRAIADCEAPVLCGIGHEIDTSVSDLAAHASFKTPTAVAAFLVEEGLAARRSLAESLGRLERAAEQPETEAAVLCQMAGDLLRLTDGVVREGRSRLLEQVRELGRLAPRCLLDAEREAGEQRVRLAAAANRAVEDPLRDLLVLAARAGATPVHVHLDRETHQLPEWRRRLGRAAADRLGRAANDLAARRDRLRLLDPANVVRRGFAILRNEDGGVIKDAAVVRRGDRIVARLRDGEIAARVESSGQKSPEGAEDGRQEGDEGGGGTGPGSRQLEIW